MISTVFILSGLKIIYLKEVSIKRIENVGNIPAYLKTFLMAMLPGENRFTEVYECKYQEIVSKAMKEKLEPQVIIDKKGTGRSFLCAVGASFRTDFMTSDESLNPVFYFAELNASKKKMFMKELTNARKEVIRQTAIRKSEQEAINAKKNDEDSSK